MNSVGKGYLGNMAYYVKTIMLSNWQSIPSLVKLREEIQEYIDEITEPGGENDYVTMNRLITGYMCACPEAKQHHCNQINQAFTSIMNKKGKYVTRVIISHDIPPNEDFCMGCGEYIYCGYVDAYQFVKLKSGEKCGYNYECTCNGGNAFIPFYM